MFKIKHYTKIFFILRFRYNKFKLLSLCTLRFGLIAAEFIVIPAQSFKVLTNRYTKEDPFRMTDGKHIFFRATKLKQPSVEQRTYQVNNAKQIFRSWGMIK